MTELEDLRAEVARLREALRAQHIYMGACPDSSQPDYRDPTCPACAYLPHGEGLWHSTDGTAYPTRDEAIAADKLEDARGNDEDLP